MPVQEKPVLVTLYTTVGEIVMPWYEQEILDEADPHVLPGLEKWRIEVETHAPGHGRMMLTGILTDWAERVLGANELLTFVDNRGASWVLPTSAVLAVRIDDEMLPTDASIRRNVGFRDA